MFLHILCEKPDDNLLLVYLSGLTERKVKKLETIPMYSKLKKTDRSINLTLGLAQLETKQIRLCSSPSIN